MRLSRRRLLIAAPFVLGAKRASAMLLHGGGTSVVSDPIAAVLATMISGQWKELTVIGSSWGGIGSAQQIIDTSALAHDIWDPGGSASPVTWATGQTAGPIGTSPAPHGVFDFSGSTVRSDGTVIHNGGGHGSGGDNSVAQFSAAAACQSILGLGGSRAWQRILDGSTYFPQAVVEPAWSAQQGSANFAAHTTGSYGANATSLTVASINTNAFAFNGGIQAAVGWRVGGPDIQPFAGILSISGTGPYTIVISTPTTNSSPATNQPIGFSTSSYWANTTAAAPHYQRLAVGHTYWYNIALGTTGYWALAGVGGWDPNFGSPPGPQAEVVKDPTTAGGTDGSSVLTTTMPVVTQRSGYGMGGLPLWCDLDSNVYCWQGSLTDSSTNHLFKIQNPTTSTPTATDLGAKGPAFGTGDTTNNQAILVQWPVATVGVDPGKRAIFCWRWNGIGFTNFALLADITGIPIGNQYTLTSTPLPVGGGTIPPPGFCFDTKRSRIVATNGAKQLGYILLDASFPQSNPANNNFTLESAGSVSGDFPTSNGAQPTDAFCRIEYLPVQDAYVLAIAGHVYLRKP